MTSILGLPAHPLFSHIPIVLIPLAAVGAVAMLWRPARERIGWVVVGLVFVSGITCQLAIMAGQSLKEYVPESDLVRAHVRMGESIRPWVLLMFLALLGWMVLELRTERTGERLRWATVTAIVFTLVFSAVSVVTIIRIGHSGSKAVWEKTQVRIDNGVKESGEVGEG
jgi:uncharacterized membrane protein